MIKVITTCWNAERWVESCVKGVIAQTYENWNMSIMTVRSTDSTQNILKQFSDNNKISLVDNRTHSTKIENMITLIKDSEPQDEDILVFLDGDDWLPDEKVFEHLISVYANDIWLTWGSYINDDGTNPRFGIYKKLPGDSEFAQTPKVWNPRGPWRYSHLKTCKYFLWKNIRDDSFRHDSTGEYFIWNDDVLVMIPMLEMAGSNHSKCIDRLMCVRNGHLDRRSKEPGFVTPTAVFERANCREIRDKKSYSEKLKIQLIKGK